MRKVAAIVRDGHPDNPEPECRGEHAANLHGRRGVGRAGVRVARGLIHRNRATTGDGPDGSRLAPNRAERPGDAEVFAPDRRDGPAGDWRAARVNRPNNHLGADRVRRGGGARADEGRRARARIRRAGDDENLPRDGATRYRGRLAQRHGGRDGVHRHGDIAKENVSAIFVRVGTGPRAEDVAASQVATGDDGDGSTRGGGDVGRDRVGHRRGVHEHGERVPRVVPGAARSSIGDGDDVLRGGETATIGIRDVLRIARF